MYVAYKLVQVVLRPELWIIGCLVAAWWLSYSARRRRGGRRLLILALLMFWALGVRPTRDALLRPLEMRYPPLTGPSQQPQEAIVVLGGGSKLALHNGTDTILGTASLTRLICGVIFWREGRAPMLVLSGGSANPFRTGVPEAEVMRDLALQLGLPASVLLTEVRSRTTAENAAEVRRLLPDLQRIILVTSAQHLARAVALFRKEGFDVTPAPCDYEVSRDPLVPTDFLPSGETLSSTGSALHEYMGIAIYWVIGRL